MNPKCAIYLKKTSFNVLPIKTAVDLWSDIIAMELSISQNMEKFSALGRDFNSQVLKHREFWIIKCYTARNTQVDIAFVLGLTNQNSPRWSGIFLKILPRSINL